LSICSDNTQKQLGDCTATTNAYGHGRDKSSQAICTRLIESPFLKVTIDDFEVICTRLIESPFLKVIIDDFEVAKMKVRPSAMREVIYYSRLGFTLSLNDLDFE